MMINKKPQTPRCGICKRLYSVKDDDGSGLCLKCRPIDGVPILNIRPEPKKMKGVGDMDFDQNRTTNMEGTNEDQKGKYDTGELPDSVPLMTSDELKIKDLILPGKKGVTNFQMIPAIQKAVDANSIEQLILLKAQYPQVFENSMRYLKKKQREFLAINLK
jgi:hypothetical protein